MLSRIRNFTLSAWLLGIAALALTTWFQAQLVDAALEEDGTTLRNAVVVLDDPGVRGGLADAVGFIAGLPGVPPELHQIAGLVETLPTLQGPVADTLIATLLDVRDQVAVQLDLPEGGMYQPVTVDLAPLLAAFDMEIDAAELEGALGVSAVPVLGGGDVAQLALFYKWLGFFGSWGLLIGVVAGILGFALSPKPLLSLAVLLGLVAAIAFTAPFVLGGVESLVSGGSLGAWGVLLGPFLAAAASAAQPWLLPTGIGAGAAAIVAIVAHLLLARRRVAQEEAEAVPA